MRANVPPPTKIINTGSRDLDRALTEVLEVFRDPRRIKEIRKTIGNRNASIDEFGKAVPTNLVLWAFALEGPSFELNLKNLPPGGRRILRLAKRLIKRHFPALVKHPAAIALLQEQAKGPTRTGMEGTTDISALNYTFTWFGKPPHLHPAVRIIFRNAEGKMLLDSTTDWLNVAFLASTLSGLFAGLLEHGEPLIAQIDKSRASELPRHIRGIETNLNTIRRLADKYGIQLDRVSVPFKKQAH